MNKSNFLHRYANTWVSLQGSGVVRPIQISSIENSDLDYDDELDDDTEVEGYDLIAGEYNLFDVDEDWLDYPTLGYINKVHMCNFLERRVEREWRRGLTFNNVVCHANPHPFSLDSSQENENIRRIFNPVYYSAQEAASRVLSDMAEEKDASCAFSPEYSFKSFLGQGVGLLFQERLIGYLKKDALVLPESLDYMVEDIDFPEIIFNREV